MPRLARKNIKVFAGNASNNGVFGSLQANNPTTTLDVEQLQSLPAWGNGWNDATMTSEELPPLEEIQGVEYVTSYQQAYIMQEGIPEWASSVTYYKGSLAKEVTSTGFRIYNSLTDDNTGNALSDTANWKKVMDSDNLYAMDDDVVHKTGVETISGMKYFSQPVVFNYASEGGEAYWIPQNTVKAAQVVTDVIDTGSGTLQWRLFSYGGSLGTRIFRFDFDNQILILPTNPASNSNNTTAATTAWVKSITTGHIQRGQIGTQGAIRTITFSSPFANTNYSVMAMCRGNEADDAYSFISESIPNRTTSSCRIYAYGSAAQSRGFDWIAIGD